MSHFEESIPQMIKMLRNLDGWIDLAVAHADEAGGDSSAFAGAKLTDDMFDLSRQVQSACDAAKFTAARLSGQEAPSKEDNETTLAELKDRIAWTVSYLEGFVPADFDGAEDRILKLRFLPEGMGANAIDYLRSFAVPNFYFHVTTAYAILRAQGVPLGKRVYLGSMNLQPL